MMESPNIYSELNDASYATYPALFAKLSGIQQKYQNMPVNKMVGVLDRIGGFSSMYSPDPTVQNKRIKSISSVANVYGKDDVSDMLRDVSSNERRLREVEHALEYTAYPLYHIRNTYQNLLTYRWYFAPNMPDTEDSKKKDFWREYKLLCKLGKEMRLKDKAHEITGQAWQEGKVFYYPRYQVDKVHNKVNHVFLQQLPSDWVKIVGYNNKSKYTLAFNLMYFTKDGTDYRQFGKLFEDYIDDFNSVVLPEPRGVGSRLVYASKSKLNLNKADELNVAADVYYQNDKWFYWVTLPIDEVFTFEIDDTSRNVVSPFSGIFLDLLQLSQLEAIQLELLQNPLVSVLTGEIPYFETKDVNTADQYKLSNAGRVLFETLWYSMLSANNTSGIGLYAAPFKNMDLHTLAESPSAMDIVSKGYQDMMSKAGLSALIPTDTEARAGAVQVSLQIESKESQSIYYCFERMIACIIEKLRLKYEWEFRMFGDIYSDPILEDKCTNHMTLGILSDLIVFNALHDRTLIDDISLSDVIINSELLDKRIPLVSTYNATSEETSGSEKKTEIVEEEKKAGRPRSEGVTSEGQEADSDSEMTGV